MIVLGVSSNYHGAAACVIRDGRPVAAAEEERFTRRKLDAHFPAHAIAYCLREASIEPSQLNAVAFYEKPARKLARVLQIGNQYAPGSVHVARQFVHVISEGVWMERTLRDHLQFDGQIYFCEHHLAHAASAFFVSPFQPRSSWGPCVARANALKILIAYAWGDAGQIRKRQGHGMLRALTRRMVQGNRE